MGKSAAGKDTLFQKILEEDPALKQVVPYTTRPVRQGEKEGVAYHFVSEDTMNDMRQQGRVIECRCYETVQGPWYYFTAEDGQIDFEQGDCCMISTLEGYEKIRDYYGKDKVVPVYIAVDDFLRMERSLAREKEQPSPCVAEVCRRFLADEEDFSGEKLKALEITDWIDNTDLSVALEQIRSLLKKGR
jgi:guanylate kinase